MSTFQTIHVLQMHKVVVIGNRQVTKLFIYSTVLSCPVLCMSVCVFYIYTCVRAMTMSHGGKHTRGDSYAGDKGEKMVAARVTATSFIIPDRWL